LFAAVAGADPPIRPAATRGPRDLAVTIGVDRQYRGRSIPGGFGDGSGARRLRVLGWRSAVTLPPLEPFARGLRTTGVEAAIAHKELRRRPAITGRPVGIIGLGRSVAATDYAALQLRGWNSPRHGPDP
jgi:hypothetical protein